MPIDSILSPKNFALSLRENMCKTEFTSPRMKPQRPVHFLIDSCEDLLVFRLIFHCVGVIRDPARRAVVDVARIGLNVFDACVRKRLLINRRTRTQKQKAHYGIRKAAHSGRFHRHTFQVTNGYRFHTAIFRREERGLEVRD